MRSPEDGPEPELDWDAPATCPSSEHVRRKVVALAPAGAPTRRARVTVTHDGERFRARVLLGDDGDVELRELDGESCDAVADAAALVIAIGPAASSPSREPPKAIVPEARALPSVAPTPAATPSEPDATPATPSSRPSAAASLRTRRSHTLRVGIAVDAGITWRTLTGVAPTIAGTLALLGDDWRVELRALGTTRTNTHPPPPADAIPVELRSTLASLRAAWVPRMRVVELPVHGGIELGGVRARPRGGALPQTRTAPWLGLAAGVGLAYVPRPWIAVRVGVEGVLALVRPRFGVRAEPDDVTLVTPRLGLRALAGVELRVAPRSGARARSRRR